VEDRYKYKHYYICTYTYIMQNIFAKVGLLEQTKEGGEEENNDRK
jgi:hypothetical protein